MRRPGLAWCGAVGIGTAAAIAAGCLTDAWTVGRDQGNSKTFAMVGASVCAALVTTPTALWLLWRRTTVRGSVAWSVTAAIAAAVVGTVCLVFVAALGAAVPDGV